MKKISQWSSLIEEPLQGRVRNLGQAVLSLAGPGPLVLYAAIANTLSFPTAVNSSRR